MRALRAWLAAAAALVGSLSLPARADVVDLVNAARMRGCSAPAARAPLRDSARLREAARRLAHAASLPAALEAAGYRATESASLHIWGTQNEAQLSSMLTRDHCATLVDPKFLEVGAERHGDDVWLIVAAPLEVPRLKDAERLDRQVLDLVNAARARGRRCGAKYFAPAAPLVMNAILSAAALEHSNEMAEYGEFKHAGHDGSTPTQRIERAGYGAYLMTGENIAAGVMTPADAMQGWLKSPEHCENIMDPGFAQIGIGFAVNLSTSWAVYWTQDFATPR